MVRGAVSERARHALKDMRAGTTLADRSRLLRQAARPIVEEALQAEATGGLGRGYCERGEPRRGYRKAYRLGRV